MATIFASRNKRNATIACKGGSKFVNEYELKLDENNRESLVKVGEINIYAQIQSFKEECEIERILERATLGDTSMLDRVKGQYLDCTEMPTTLAEAQNTIIRIRNEFDKLPLEIRSKFDNSPENYVAKYGTEEWLGILGINKEEKIEVKEEVVNE